MRGVLLLSSVDVSTSTAAGPELHESALQTTVLACGLVSIHSLGYWFSHKTMHTGRYSAGATEFSRLRFGKRVWYRCGGKARAGETDRETETETEKETEAEPHILYLSKTPLGMLASSSEFVPASCPVHASRCACAKHVGFAPAAGSAATSPVTALLAARPRG